MKNLTIENLVKCTGGELIIPAGFDYDKTSVATAVVTDSRQAGKNSVFIAIPGEHVDGHNFVDAVLAGGALCAVTERRLDINSGIQIVVENSCKALACIGTFYREQLNIPIIGITGSVGKTSTKEMIASVLSERFKVQKTAGNFNNEIGLPLTLCTISAEHEAAVTEMGISDFGEMTRLSMMSKPNIMVITNIGICHLENLKTRDGILKAKTECFDNLSDNAVVILNGDDDKLCTVAEVQGKKPIFYGIGKCVTGLVQEHDNAVYQEKDVYATDVVNLGLRGVDFTLHMNGDSHKAHTSLPGEHNVYNACAAAAVGLTLGLTVDEILEGIRKGQTIAGRSNIISVEKDDMSYLLIDDCYNANPVSMREGIDILATAEGRKIAVLGDMGELGDDEAKLHYEVGTYVANSSVDAIFLCGELSKNMRDAINAAGDDASLSKDLYYFENRDALIDSLKAYVKDGDTILIKASHFMGYASIVSALNK